MKTLYRAYRPRRFAEVVGQEVAVTLLRNAVVRDRLAHAYLFAGPRGVGKTSLAKILAQAVNCRAPEDGEPCGVCPECVKTPLHTVEMDAASNRGIDEIRELRERVRYAPAVGRIRTYILDEAHMLTPEAFNALLKTLEEPPEHLLFVLATTEPERIPDTVLSRCQRVPFRRLTVEEIARHILKVGGEEGLSLSEEAAHFLARLAEGSLRDGLALLDMVATYATGTIDLDTAARAVGGVHPGKIAELFAAVRQGDGELFLRLYRDLLAEGADPEVLADAFLDEFRRLAEAEVSRASEEAGRAVEALRALLEARQRMRLAASPELVLEATLLALLVGDVARAPSPTPSLSSLGSTRGASGREGAAATLPKEGRGRAEVQGDEAREGGGPSGDRALWERLRTRVRGSDPRTHALLERAEVAVEGGVVVLTFAYPSHRVLAEQYEHRRILEAALRELLGKDVTLSFRVKGASS